MSGFFIYKKNLYLHNTKQMENQEDNKSVLKERSAVLRKPRSHKAYQVNLDDKEIVEVDNIDLEKSSKHKIYFVIKPRTLYCSALNKINAKKNFDKQISFLINKQR